MKVSSAIAQSKLDRARQIVSKRKVLGSDLIGQVVTLAIQGNGNMLNSRPAMIYNVNATTLDRALLAKKALGAATFFATIDEMDEQEIDAHINDVLNNSQLSFTVPLTSTERFENRDLVTALVETYTTKATEDRPATTGVGLNNVKHVKAVAIANSNVFSNWDDEDATIEDAPDSTPEAKQDDPFADSNVEAPAAAKA